MLIHYQDYFISFVLFFCWFLCVFSCTMLGMDRIVISSRQAASLSPRAHKSHRERRDLGAAARSEAALRLPLYPRFPRRATQAHCVPLLFK